MRLESARDLKAELRSVLFDEAALSRRAVSAYGLAAAPVATIERSLPTAALGISPRRPRDFRLAVRVQRRGFESSSHVELIRERARGEVDLRFVGRVVKRSTPWHRSRHRPLLIGSSVGHYEITAGTLGCFVRLKDGRTGILSNNHVLANENHAARGDPIIQPGRYDGGRDPRDAVATLAAYVRLRRSAVNDLDCALGALVDDVDSQLAALKGSGQLRGLADDVPEDTVLEKLGRTTGRTRGRVTSLELDGLIVSYDIGNLRFAGVTEIEGVGRRAFSAGGDSGSVIYARDGKLALALLFAGSEQGGSNGEGLTYAHSLSAALESLDAELLL
jgi:hypothetical protein